MIQFINEGGPYMWGLLALALVVVVLAVKKSIQLFGKTEWTPDQLGTGLNAIVFWGGMSAVLGFYAHFLGIYYAMQEIARASDISPAIVARGYQMALTTVLTGLFIFMISAIIWFILKWQLKRRLRT